MKCKMKRLLPILLVLLTSLPCITGCRNPLNAGTGARYYESGLEAEKRGDLVLARRNYSRAYWNAQVGRVGSATEAYSLYEWSRVSGYLGMHSDAERGFTNVLALIDKAKGKAEALRAPALSELARFYYDTRQYAKGVPIFEPALQELEKRDALKADPIAFAEFLDDYASCLKTAAFSAQADAIAKKAAVIREQHKNAVPKFKPRRYAL